MKIIKPKSTSNITPHLANIFRTYIENVFRSVLKVEVRRRVKGWTKCKSCARILFINIFGFEGGQNIKDVPQNIKYKGNISSVTE